MVPSEFDPGHQMDPDSGVNWWWCSCGASGTGTYKADTRTIKDRWRQHLPSSRGLLTIQDRLARLEFLLDALDKRVDDL